MSPSAADSAMYMYRRLLRYVVPHWPIFALATFASIAYAATEPLFAAWMKPMLDEGFVARDPEAIRWLPVTLIALFLARGVAGFAASYGMNWVGRTVVYSLRKEMFDHLLHLPASFYDRFSSGQLISKLTYDVEQVAKASTSALTVIVRDTFTTIGLLAWMFYLSGLLALVILLTGPPMALVVMYVSRRFRNISRKIQRSMGDVTHVTQEAVEGQQVVKTFNGRDYERAHFDKVNRNNRRQHLKMMTTSALSVPITQLLVACALAGIIYLATSPATSSITTPGDFVSFITAMLLLLPALKRLATVNATLQKGIAAAESIFSLLDTPTEEARGQRPLQRAQGRIEFRAVNFHYGSRAGRVLHDVSFVAEPGEVIALVGRSGSGKSTLVNILPRFYDVDGGSVFLDDQDIRDYRLADLRRQIAMVSQQVTLFNDTIANNIAYGYLQGRQLDDVKSAARAAHADVFIEQLPDGYDTVVGDKGVLLSGGQRQRLAIARAILKDAPVLILDEATSALDSEAEQHVQEGLKALMNNRTTLVIAHRLSTVEHAHRILVLDQGRIVESGSHHELLERRGAYASLYRMQFHETSEPSRKADTPTGLGLGL